MPLYDHFPGNTSESDDVIYDQYELHREVQAHLAEQLLDLDEYFARQLSEESALEQFGRRSHENSLAQRSQLSIDGEARHCSQRQQPCKDCFKAASATVLLHC